ncbi:uncharacterized protein LOC125495518 [Beta vulgaris subsp. vulgaris]|uniref:uncharacterized protein LOC125495518 n=1 Tax=Beta vulgaris subsp. vulgaris TaxID=3555 RepID=UPI0020368A5B|nr:uncharacterized protein LOC125495518 [Beta vulgaris subsp. vulgaris]
MLSLQKSFVKFSPNVPENAQQDYQRILAMETRSSLGNYLGAPIDFQGSKVTLFTHLLDKASSRITSWNQSFLSQPAKVIIINSILIGALMHYLAVFRIPTTIANKLDSLFAAFFWKDSHGKGLQWKNRATIQKPKGEGGLGIRNVGLFNTALLMRKASRIRQNPNLLVSQIYKRSTSSRLHHMTHITLSSWGRRGIVTASTLLDKLSNWKIGNGRDIHVTTPTWMNGSTPIFRDQVPLSAARDIRVADLMVEGQRRWNLSKLYAMFEPSSARQIRSIELPPAPNICDEQYWPHTKSGSYTTKSGYAILLQQQNEIYSMTSSLDKDFFRVLWGSRIMPIWKLFIWKLWHNGFATKKILYRRQISDSSECPICLHDCEDTNHLFRYCPLAIEAWGNRDLGINRAPVLAMPMREWLRSWIMFFYKKDGYYGSRLPAFVATLWTIWLLRNEQVFRQFHAVWDKHTLSTGIGWAFRESPNQPIRQFGCYSYASSTIAALSLACLKVVTWAQLAGYLHITLTTSSTSLIQNLKTRGSPDISIKWTTDAIRNNAFTLNSCEVVRVSKLQITEAQQVALWCRQHEMDFG